MGLDMYLIRNGRWTEEDGEPYLDWDYDRDKAAYWRKANQIHAWFVDHVQGGTDDCGWYEVTPDQLSELLALVIEVKANPGDAARRLPTRSGFFFGSTDYGDPYREDLDSTIDQLSSLIPTVAPTDTIYYHSSW